MNMNRFLYWFAKTWLGAILLHWTVAYFTFLLPGKKLVETNSLVAFFHPSPSYPLHILIVPKRTYRSVTNLPSEDLVFEKDLFTAVRKLVQQFGLEDGSYRLIANGGSAQEVDQLHFHLVSEDYRRDGIPGK
jgi:histidine triad (HIT) family protein